MTSRNLNLDEITNKKKIENESKLRNFLSRKKFEYLYTCNLQPLENLLILLETQHGICQISSIFVVNW